MKKRILSVLLILGMLFTVILVANSAQAEDDWMLQGQTSVYLQHDTNSSIVAVAGGGTIYTIIDSTAQTPWIKIAYSDQQTGAYTEGWINESLLESPSSPYSGVPVITEHQGDSRFRGDSQLRRLSGSAFFGDVGGYSVYAVAEETAVGIFDVRISLQLSQNFVMVLGFEAYQLRLGNGTVVDIPAEGQDTGTVATSFHATVALPEAVTDIQVVPVYNDGHGPSEAESFTISQAIDEWDAPIGTLAMVRTSQSTSRLNLRCTPSEEGDIWMGYYTGTPLVITNVLSNGWVAVTIGANATESGPCGYMKAKYLALGSDVAQVRSAMPTYRASSSFTVYDSPSAALKGIAVYDRVYSTSAKTK